MLMHPSGVLQWRKRNGQVAAVFIVVMAIIVLLAAMTMNVGRTAGEKTATANAADGAAIAAASWVASGENEMVYIARGMSINAMIVQLIYVIPFCLDACDIAIEIMAALILTNLYYLRVAADLVADSAWDFAHAAALQTVISNAPIDATDDNEKQEIQRELRDISDHFRDSEGNIIGGGRDNPLGGGMVYAIGDSGSYHYGTSWNHTGADGVPRLSRLDVDVEFMDPPIGFGMGGDWGPTFLCWSWCFGISIAAGSGAATCAAASQTCCLCICIDIDPYVYICPGCVWPCFTAAGWSQSGGESATQNAQNAQQQPSTAMGEDAPESPDSFFSGFISQLGGVAQYIGQKAWAGSIGKIIPENFSLGSCSDQTCLPLPFSAGGEVCPGSIDNGTGDIRVTVRLSRPGGGGRLNFWETRAPDIVSSATAHYGGASLGGCFDWHSPDAVAHLTDAN